MEREDNPSPLAVLSMEARTPLGEDGHRRSWSSRQGTTARRCQHRDERNQTRWIRRFGCPKASGSADHWIVRTVVAVLELDLLVEEDDAGQSELVVLLYDGSWRPLPSHQGYRAAEADRAVVAVDVESSHYRTAVQIQQLLAEARVILGLDGRRRLCVTTSVESIVRNAVTDGYLPTGVFSDRPFVQLSRHGRIQVSLSIKQFIKKLN